MQTRFCSIQGLLLAAVFALATPFLCAAQSEAPADLQWIRVNDERLQWLNVGDWGAQGRWFAAGEGAESLARQMAGTHGQSGAIGRRCHRAFSDRFQEARFSRYVR